MFIMEMFGFKDLPTLTHEMLGDRGTQTAAAPPTEERQGEVARKNILQFGRVHQELIRLAGPRTIDHDPRERNVVLRNTYALCRNARGMP